MTDQAAFLAAVVADSEDDTVRLAYADWLQENEESTTESCPSCKVVGQKSVQKYIEFSGGFTSLGKCIVCNGTGVVRQSNGFADRAEFIRLQIELAATPHGPFESHNLQYIDTQNRIDALLSIHPEWRPLCPVCGNRTKDDTVNSCGLCSTKAAFYPGRVGAFERGFLRSVTVPRLADVLEHRPDVACPNFENAIQCSETGAWECCKACDYTGVAEFEGYYPTAWACDLVRDFPTVKRVVCLDQVPYEAAGPTVGKAAWVWWEDEQPDGTEDVPGTVPRGAVFNTLWNNWKPQQIKNVGRSVWFVTRADAADALAEVVATVLRELHTAGSASVSFCN